MHLFFNLPFPIGNWYIINPCFSNSLHVSLPFPIGNWYWIYFFRVKICFSYLSLLGIDTFTIVTGTNINSNTLPFPIGNWYWCINHQQLFVSSLTFPYWELILINFADMLYFSIIPYLSLLGIDTQFRLSTILEVTKLTFPYWELIQVGIIVETASNSLTFPYWELIHFCWCSNHFINNFFLPFPIGNWYNERGQREDSRNLTFPYWELIPKFSKSYHFVFLLTFPYWELIRIDVFPFFSP